MKRFLTAAAAVSLLAAGAAYAQTTTGGGSAPDQSGSMAGGQMAQPGATTPDASGSMPQGGAMPDQAGGSMQQGGATADQSGGAMTQGGAMPESTGAAQTADTPAAAPSSYPPCTSRTEDHCQQSAGTQRKLRKEYGGKRVARQMKHHKAAMAAGTAAETPATPQ